MIEIGDLKWAAGFLEGEGSFNIQKRNRVIRVAASQVQQWPLVKLQVLFGGRMYYHRNGSGPKHPTPRIWNWCLNHTHSAAVMMTLYPLMSPRRQEQIRAALAEWRILRQYQRATCPHGHSRAIFAKRKKNGHRRCTACEKNYASTRPRRKYKKARLRIVSSKQLPLIGDSNG